MTVCDSSSTKEKPKKSSSNTTYGACAIDSTELFGEHDIDYIESQLTSSVDRQLIRDTLTDNQGDIDATIAHLLALDTSISQTPTTNQESNESIERIMSITGIYDIDAIQKSFSNHNFDIDATVESLLTLTTKDNKKKEENPNEEISENEEETQKPQTKNKPVSNRQAKIDKKKAKKQRATEKHRAQILAAAGKTETKPTEDKAEPTVNNEQENGPPANMEFISI